MWWLAFLELVSEHKVPSGKIQGAAVLWEGNVRQKNNISRETRCLPSFEGLNFLFFPLPYSNCWPSQVVLAAPGSNPQRKHHHTTHSLPEKNWFLQASRPSAAEAVVLAAAV